MLTKNLFTLNDTDNPLADVINLALMEPPMTVFVNGNNIDASNHFYGAANNFFLFLKAPNAKLTCCWKWRFFCVSLQKKCRF